MHQEEEESTGAMVAPAHPFMTQRGDDAIDVVANSAAPSTIRHQDDATGGAAGTGTLSLSVTQPEADVPAVCTAVPVPPQDDGVLMLAGPVALSGTEGLMLTGEAFLNNVVCHAMALLRAPTTREPGNTMHPTTSTPRHSNRIAGAGVEFQMDEMARRSTKKVMKSLNIIGENEGAESSPGGLLQAFLWASFKYSLVSIVGLVWME
jgi:hypothetical protein